MTNLGQIKAKIFGRTAAIDNQREITELLEDLKIVQDELIAANSNYDFANEHEMVDYYSYMIKATQIRYDYILKKIKESGQQMCSQDLYQFMFVKNNNLNNSVNAR